MKRTTSSRKESSHERILDAAARAIRRSGYGGTGVADIMREAGLTHGGFYAHFNSREEMLAEAADRAGAESVAAMARIASTAPARKALQMMPDVYMVFDGASVDQIIEKAPGQARFLAGLVAWQPGELRDEIKRGAWYVLDPELALVLRKPTEGMWEELVRRAELRANGI